MNQFDAAGVKVYALSYDEADALRDFRTAKSTTFRLLSDPDSVVIRELGILNTLIAEDDHPWFGIPYPGTYVLDSAGVITHKFFDSNLAVRTGPEQLLKALHGEQITAESVPRDPPDEVTTEVLLDGENLAVSVQRDLIARWQLPPGRHLYASPAPSGSVAATIELDDNPRLVQRDLIRPASETHELADTNERFQVHHGQVELRLPLTINGAVTKSEAATAITLKGTLRYQTCDDTVCDIPVSEPFELTVPVVGSEVPDMRAPKDAPDSEPAGARHFKKMIERRKS